MRVASDAVLAVLHLTRTTRASNGDWRRSVGAAGLFAPPATASDRGGAIRRLALFTSVAVHARPTSWTHVPGGSNFHVVRLVRVTAEKFYSSMALLWTLLLEETDASRGSRLSTPLLQARADHPNCRIPFPNPVQDSGVWASRARRRLATCVNSALLCSPKAPARRPSSRGAAQSSSSPHE
jgi:hypothetical protein